MVFEFQLSLHLSKLFYMYSSSYLVYCATLYVSINSVIMSHMYLSSNICPDVSLIMFIRVRYLCLLRRSLQFCQFHG